MKHFIGEGSGRTVYKCGRHKVWKVAKNDAGQMQNQTEAKLPSSHLCAKVYNHHPNYEWVKMEYAPVLSLTEFQEFVGYSRYIFETYMHYKFFHDFFPDEKLVSQIDENLIKKVNFAEMDKVQLFKDITTLAIDNHLSIMDITRHDAWGRSKITNNIVLVDYGLTYEIYKTCYTRLQHDYRMTGHIYKKNCVVPNEVFRNLKPVYGIRK